MRLLAWTLLWALVLFLLALVWWNDVQGLLPKNKKKNHVHHRFQNSLKTHLLRRNNNSPRIAVIIPFVGGASNDGSGGESIPPYLPLFCAAARGSAALVDFLIVHNGALEHYANNQYADNIRFINLGSTLGMAEKLVSVLDGGSEELAVSSKEFLEQVVAKHVERYPYVLVEFKPALGHIFAEYLVVCVTMLLNACMCSFSHVPYCAGLLALGLFRPRYCLW